MSLLLTVWDEATELASDLFLGEVLLDLASADVRGSLVWYDLQEHDLNCSSVPVPSPKVSRTVAGGISVLRSSSMSRQSSKDSSGRNTVASPDISSTINHFTPIIAHVVYNVRRYSLKVYFSELCSTFP